MESSIALRARSSSVALSVLIVIAGVLTVLMLSVRPASASPAAAYPPPPPSSSSQSGTDSANESRSATDPQIVTKPLASTGSNDVLFLNIGGALVVLGAFTVYLARRRTN
jgi:LPXTG-motif cell wall-anchored protein